MTDINVQVLPLVGFSWALAIASWVLRERVVRFYNDLSGLDSAPHEVRQQAKKVIVPVVFFTLFGLGALVLAFASG